MTEQMWFPWTVRIGAILSVAVICWFVWKLTKLHSKGDDLAKKESGATAKAIQPAYTYKQMMQDLSDKRLSIDEILERCQGKLPKELTDAIDAEKPSVAPPLNRGLERLEWFTKVAQGVPNYKVVPPPPQPPPVVAVKGWVTLCSCRRGMGSPSITEPTYGQRRGYLIGGVRCQACLDRGFVFITGG
jgi:hypothetical protein